MDCRVQSRATAWRGTRCWPQGCGVVSCLCPAPRVMPTLRTQWAPLYCPALSIHTLGELGGTGGIRPIHSISTTQSWPPAGIAPNLSIPGPLWLQIGARLGGWAPRQEPWLGLACVVQSTHFTLHEPTS